MDWLFPHALFLILPALALLWWCDLKSTHPMGPQRRRVLFVLRALLVILGILAIASPARILTSREQAVMFVLDHSRSEGEAGISSVYSAAETIRSSLNGNPPVGYIAAGTSPELISYPDRSAEEVLPEERARLAEAIGASSNYERAVTLARGLFPTGTSKHIVLVGDGVETGGSLLAAAEEAAISGIKIHAAGIAGDIQPDVRVTRLTSSQSRLNEGAR